MVGGGEMTRLWEKSGVRGGGGAWVGGVRWVWQREGPGKSSTRRVWQGYRRQVGWEGGGGGGGGGTRGEFVILWVL